MVQKGDNGTLTGRLESHGTRFPWYLEKLAFLLSVTGAIIFGQWMWISSGWSGTVLWPITICGLPLETVFVAESVSRMVQSVYIASSK